MVLLLALLRLAFAWDLTGQDGAPAGQLDPERLFAEAPAPWGADAAVRTDPAALAEAARGALDYLRRSPDPKGAQPGLFGELGVDLCAVEATLAFVARVAEEDVGGARQRLQDPAFLAEHFRYIQWKADAAAAAKAKLDLSDGRLRITKYVVWQQEGRLAQEAGFPNALYALPEDEAGLSVEEAEARPDLLRKRFTRAEVLGGVYEAGGAAEGRATPLVWLSREGVLEAMMQGTVAVTLPDGRAHLYNVDRANGMPYLRGTRAEAQRRYWYFREVDRVRGWGPDPASRVPLVAGVSVAGDVANLGLGKLILLRSPEPGGEALRLVVLADTGGAFQPNLFQLDLLAGTYPDRASFLQGVAGLPERAAAGVLLLRRADECASEGKQPVP